MPTQLTTHVQCRSLVVLLIVWGILSVVSANTRPNVKPAAGTAPAPAPVVGQTTLEYDSDENGYKSEVQPSVRTKNVKIPSDITAAGTGPGASQDQPPASSPNRNGGEAEAVPHKKKRQGGSALGGHNGNGKGERRSGQPPSQSKQKTVATDGDSSWTLVPFVMPQVSKPVRISEEDDEDDELDEEEEEDVDDPVDEHDDEDDDEDEHETEEIEVDTTADDILTDGNYDEKLPDSKISKDSRPNIILILTDDQDIELGSMEYMPETLKSFRDQGVEFRHGYVTTPMCCPSRSSILTGLYVHNHQVYTNNDNCSSIQWRENFERKTFASYLFDSGYYTSYIGKYLNKYDGSHIPYGWDEWNALLMNSRFYNYTVNRNGVKTRYGSNYKQDYYPNSIANDTINFLQRMAAASFQNSFSGRSGRVSSETNATTVNAKRKIQQPFLLVASFPSPHGPEDSAPEYKDMFLNTTAHHTPSYNYAPNLDKQWILRVTSKMNPTLKNFTNTLMTKRLQTLQSVDLAVSKIMTLLQQSGLSENTYVFYTSDHGYHVGQFGLVKGKSMPYEFDIRVPFFVSPPKSKTAKVPPGGTMIYEPVLNIDLAPTFLDLGHLPVPDDMDGRSMMPLLNKYSKSNREDSDSVGDDYIDDETDGNGSQDLKWTHSFLIESSGRRDGSANRNSDQTTNSNSSATLRSVLTQFDNLSTKKSTITSSQTGADRFMTENETSATELALCQLHPYPCELGQKKYCRREKNRIRFRKCRYEEDFVQTPPSYGYGFEGNISVTYSTLGFDRNGQICKCPRIKRSASTIIEGFQGPVDMNSTEEHDWEKERQKIDDEIELLKLRIEELRERRRDMRRKISQGIHPTSAGSLYTNDTVSNVSPKTNDAFRSPPLGSGSMSASSFLPISIGQPKRPKKIKNNNVPLMTPVPTSGNNVSFMNAFNLYPKIDFTTFLNVDGVRREPGKKKENRRQYETTTFHSSGELFEDYDDEDGIFEGDDIGELDPTDYPVVVVGPAGNNKRPGHQKSSRRKSNGNEDRTQNQNSRDKKPKGGRRNGDTDENRDELENQRSGRKKSKEQRNKSRIDPLETFDGTSPKGGSFGDLDGDDEYCDCSGDSQRNTPRWLRQQEREERKRKKLLSKLRKKQRFLHRIVDASERHQAETCGTEDKVNCFWHDKSHWRTEPKWTLESFCFCMNANNNTYSCVRTINSTHNYLYCQFITGFKMYFNLNQDPYQLHNVIATLPAHEEDWMLATLLKLKKCQGHQDCFMGNESISLSSTEVSPDVDSESVKVHEGQRGRNRTSKVLEPSIWERIFGSRRKKQKKHHRNRNGNDESFSGQSRKLKQM